MELLKQPPLMKLPAEWFTGDAYADAIHRGEDPSRTRADMVRFTTGARTARHSHGLGQTLRVVEGIALVQSRGGDIVEAHPSDVIRTPPGEEHWHGAAPDRFMVHLALWETDDATWLGHVSDDEHNGRRVSTRTRP